MKTMKTINHRDTEAQRKSKARKPEKTHINSLSLEGNCENHQPQRHRGTEKVKGEKTGEGFASLAFLCVSVPLWSMVWSFRCSRSNELYRKP
jgi:hypothetical protein